MYSQGSPDYTGGLKVKFNEDGSKYLRIISWAQVQANYNTDPADNTAATSFNLRRARVLMFSQINKDFLILTHFGLNSLNASNMHPTGKNDSAQLFLHDMWVQYNVAKDHVIGGVLHYFNVISRLNNQSTLNMMTLDNNRQSWSTIGLSDQFARHIGIFAKGKFGKLQYRVAINDAIATTLNTATKDENGNVLKDGVIVPADGNASYNGVGNLGTKDAGKAYAGYFDFHFLDQESNFLPYKVGSYLGGKKIFNIGAGFLLHPNGATTGETVTTTATVGGVTETTTKTTYTGQDVSIFAIDAFYDAPLGDNGSALTAYAVFQSNDYGKNYLHGSTYGTGSMVYGHVGYVISGDVKKTRYQPYVSYGANSYDASDDNNNIFGIGINAYMSGHNSKLTLEYKSQQFGALDANTISLQAMIYL